MHEELFIVTEYMLDLDLESLLKKHGGIFTIAEKALILLYIVRGMKVLEELGITHRDLAAKNILVSHNAKQLIVKIGDLGSACFGDYVGFGYDKMTITHRAPEIQKAQKEGKEHPFTPKSDVWSFGIVAWEVLREDQNDKPEHLSNFKEKGRYNIEEYKARMCSYLPVVKGQMERTALAGSIDFMSEFDKEWEKIKESQGAELKKIRALNAVAKAEKVREELGARRKDNIEMCHTVNGWLAKLDIYMERMIKEHYDLKKLERLKNDLLCSEEVWKDFEEWCLNDDVAEEEEVQKLRAMIDKKKELMNAVEKVEDMVKRCGWYLLDLVWQESPEDRPRFGELAYYLEAPHVVLFSGLCGDWKKRCVPPKHLGLPADKKSEAKKPLDPVIESDSEPPAGPVMRSSSAEIPNPDKDDGIVE